MTGVSHRQFGYAWAAGTALIMEPYWGWIGCLALFVGVRPGSTAPDWLEFGLIKHRTLTHLPWLWVLMYALSVSMVAHFELGIVVACLVTGFCLGALSHWVGDVGTPMGVPLWHPNKRFSINMWSSGKFSEKVPVLIAWGLVGIMASLKYYLTPAAWSHFFYGQQSVLNTSAGWLIQELKGPLF